MYAVKCYDADGMQFGEADYFNTLDDANAFAEDMADNFLVDIVTPNGTIICIN
jgi:hypothetical protein